MSCGSVSKHVCVGGGAGGTLTLHGHKEFRKEERLSLKTRAKERERNKISSFQGILKFVSNETFNSIVFLKGLFYF